MQRISKTVPIDLPLLITSWESNALINSSNHYFLFYDCHSFYHFLTSTFNESCFTSFDLHRSTSHYSDFFRMVEALQPSLMVISSPHCLDMTAEYDNIHFPSQDSHRNLVPLIENSSFQTF